MKFAILYCKPCGYQGDAKALAEELRQRFSAEVSVVEGGFGQFDVLLDDELVASKGGIVRRMLTHGAPAQRVVLEAIERRLVIRDGDSCEISERGR